MNRPYRQYIKEEEEKNGLAYYAANAQAKDGRRRDIEKLGRILYNHHTKGGDQNTMTREHVRKEVFRVLAGSRMLCKLAGDVDELGVIADGIADVFWLEYKTGKR